MSLDQRRWAGSRRRQRRLPWRWVGERLPAEERLYAAAVLLGVLLLAWAGLQALDAQGRFPVPVLRLPGLEEFALPGRPVLVPVVESGQLVIATSAPATAGRLVVQAGDDVAAEVELGEVPLGRPARLVIRGNLPRILAPPPGIERFAALRLLEVLLVDARTGEPLDAPLREVQVRVAIRPVDLEYARGEPARLLLLHYAATEGAWEDTRASAEQGYLVGRVSSLSPFVVGLGEEAPPPWPPVPALPLQAQPTEPGPTSVPVLTIATPGSGDRLFDVAAMKPGDVAVANVVIQNGGNVDVTLTLAVDATTSSVLDQDLDDGLQLTVKRCEVSFTRCDETAYSGPAIVADAGLGGPQTVGGAGGRPGLRAASQDYLELQFRFPASAGNQFQRARSVLRLTWTGTEAP